MTEGEIEEKSIEIPEWVKKEGLEESWLAEQRRIKQRVGTQDQWNNQIESTLRSGETPPQKKRGFQRPPLSSRTYINKSPAGD